MLLGQNEHFQKLTNFEPDEPDELRSISGSENIASSCFHAVFFVNK